MIVDTDLVDPEKLVFQPKARGRVDLVFDGDIVIDDAWRHHSGVKLMRAPHSNVRVLVDTEAPELSI